MFRSGKLSRILLRESAIKVENACFHTPVPRSNLVKTPLSERLRAVKPSAYFTLAIPITSGALGLWQIKRCMWKTDIIEQMEARIRHKPIPLPHTLEEISNLEYTPIRVKGHFDHSREIIMGPRTRLNAPGPASTLLSNGALAGYLVYTPFKPNDRDHYILVNRGWVPSEKRDPKFRKEGQIEEEVELVGLIRLSDKKPQFVMENDPDEHVWLYRDLDRMAAVANTAPICIDALEDSSVPGGPIGGQTLINLRNVHVSYAATWLTLSLLSAIIWWSNNVPAAMRRLRK